MTRLLEDIEQQPVELLKSLDHTLGPGLADLNVAIEIVRSAKHVYIAGIGSSWHAAMAVASRFAAAGRNAQAIDASELIHFTKLPADSVVVALSRSGKSVEIVKLLDQARRDGARVIGVTNTPDSPLGQHATVRLDLAAAFDHVISITMYSALTLVGGVLADGACNVDVDALGASLRGGLQAAQAALPVWREQVERSSWFADREPVYFLARGGSVASAYETRLLWEEAAKLPASATSTGGFRHGPQEILEKNVRIGQWIDAAHLREADLALAADMRGHGASTLLIGHGLSADAADLVLDVPALPDGWQFLVDILPGQLAAERQARLHGADCDAFRICPYVIESEGGL